MALIPSAPNEWPQNNQIDDQKAGSLNSPTSNNTSMASVGGLVMDQKVLPITPNHHQLPHPHQHQTQQQQQQQQKQNQEPLRCPRCDSTNTKFCYYNNYSLSQPRHFCKACKRYWTRGGTLRNVPVGGGCRKNKRVKRPTSNNSCSSANSLTNTTTSANSSEGGGQNIHDLISSASNHHINPLFFGIPTNPHHHSDINFPFSRYDLQNPSQNSSIHHHGGLGLGFANSPASNNSSGLIHGMSGLSFNGVLHNHHPVNPSSKQIFQDLISSNANPLMNVNINPTSTTDSPTLSSLLASTIQMKGGNSSSNFQTLLPPSSSYEDHELQMKGSSGQGNSGTGPTGGMFVKDVKMELEGQNRSLDHHSWGINHHQVEDNHTNSSADPSLLWGVSANNLGAWLDPSNNLGSSVPSLI